MDLASGLHCIPKPFHLSETGGIVDGGSYLPVEVGTVGMAVAGLQLPRVRESVLPVRHGQRGGGGGGPHDGDGRHLRLREWGTTTTALALHLLSF